MTNGSVMKVESIAELEHSAILLTCWSWKPIFGFLESGRFRQILLSLTFPIYGFPHIQRVKSNDP